MPWARKPKVEIGDAHRDETGAPRAEGEAHHVRGGGRARGETIGPERAQADDVHREVEHDDAGDAQEERARHVALRPLQLAHDEAGGLPAAVGEEDGHEGGAERGQRDRETAVGRAPGAARRARRRRPRSPTATSPRIATVLSTISSDCTSLPGPHAEAVDGGQRGQGQDGHARLGQRQRHELAQVAREGHGHRGHPAALRDEEERPAVEEGHPRAVGLAQVGVLTAHRGP